MGNQRRKAQPQGCLFALLESLLSPRSAELDKAPYRLRDDFLSSAELEFFHVLEKMVPPEYLIIPKVRVADILFVPNHDYKYFNKIAAKHVDFLIVQKPHMRPVCAIELDDSSHTRASRYERDAWLEKAFSAAGFPLLRFQLRRAYSLSELRETLQSVLPQTSPAVSSPATSVADMPAGVPPLCPKCGVPMVLRQPRRGEKSGTSFYGCANYPRCKAIVPVPNEVDQRSQTVE